MTATRATVERVYDVFIEEENAVNAAADRTCNRDGMVGMYADCIIADHLERKRGGTNAINWKRVNAAILERWPKGLVYIKEGAWRALGEKAK